MPLTKDSIINMYGTLGDFAARFAEYSYLADPMLEVEFPEYVKQCCEALSEYLPEANLDLEKNVDLCVAVKVFQYDAIGMLQIYLELVAVKEFGFSVADLYDMY